MSPEEEICERDSPHAPHGTCGGWRTIQGPTRAAVSPEELRQQIARRGARADYPIIRALIGVHEQQPSSVNTLDELNRALNEIDALRARVVVAEEALVVAHEDADRLAALWDYITWKGRLVPTPRSQSEETESVLADHLVAVSSRPKERSDG